MVSFDFGKINSYNQNLGFFLWFCFFLILHCLSSTIINLHPFKGETPLKNYIWYVHQHQSLDILPCSVSHGILQIWWFEVISHLIVP